MKGFSANLFFTGDLIPFDSIPSISKFGPITRTIKPVERIVSPLAFGAMQHQGMHQGSSSVVNAAAVAAVAAQLSFSQQESAENSSEARASKRTMGSAAAAAAAGLSDVGRDGARMQEIDQIDEEIHKLDRRINRVYEEEVLKQKLADVEAEIKRFELGNQRPPVGLPTEVSQNEHRNEPQRFGATAGKVGGIDGNGVCGNAMNMELPNMRNMHGDDEPTAVQEECRQQHQQADMTNQELSLTRQMMFDQQMLAIARQMMDLQHEAAMGAEAQATQVQSLDLYQAFLANAEADQTATVQAPAIASAELSPADNTCGGRANGVIARNGQAEGNLEHLSASEQRQWQRLQRQFDKPDNICQEAEKPVANDYTMPFGPDSK